MSSTYTNATTIDVRLKDDFEAEHLPEAVSCCVFEVGFLDDVAEEVSDLSAPVRVYGASSESAEGQVAVGKLLRAGYTDVAELPGGIAGWKEKGETTVTGTPLAPVPVPEGIFELDLEECRVGWTGRNLINSHSGSLGLKSGHLEFVEGMLSGGRVVFDMGAIACSDLEGEMHDVLVAHLQNDDFFDVERYPEAVLEIRSARPVPGTTAGAPNLEVEAALTLKGQTHPLVFLAAAGIGEGGRPAAQAAFSFDRTRWGVLYGSGKLFARLAGHLVNDHIEIQTRILTK